MGDMEIVSVRLIRERDQSRNFVLLHCFDGVGPLLATIARTDVDEFARQPLLPSDQNFLVEKNLGTLASIIAAKYKRGEVTERTIPRGRKVHALIELTQDDLEQGLKRHQVVADAPIGTEFGKTAVPSVPPPTQPPPASLGDGGSEAANRILAAWPPRWHSSLQPPQRTSALVPGAALGGPNDRTGEAPGGATSITQTALLAAWHGRPREPQSVLNPGVRG